MKTKYCEVRVGGEVEVVANRNDIDDLMKTYKDVEGATITPLGSKTLGNRRTSTRGYVLRGGRWWTLTSAAVDSIKSNTWTFDDETAHIAEGQAIAEENLQEEIG